MPRLASAVAAFLAGINSRDNVCSNTVTDFELVDASVRPPIITDLTEVVDLLDFPTCQLSVQAIVTSEPEGCNRGDAKCVKFFLDGAEAKKERTASYTICMETKGICTSPGSHPSVQFRLKRAHTPIGYVH
jgi:hypothetical protein